jgi:plasmid stabilization system protein ParE
VKAYIVVAPKVWEQLETLRTRDLRVVLAKIDQLADFPLSAPPAPYEGCAEYRRAVAGDYCIVYEYCESPNVVYILSVRHGRQMPPTREELEQAKDEI